MYRVFQPFRLQPPLVAPVAWLVSATGRTVEANHRIRLTHSGRVSPTSIGLRLGLAGSPRRQAESSSSSYGLIVHLPMLSTSPRRDAVPVGYGTQARPRQGLPPCWFDTLTIARVPGLPSGAFIGCGQARCANKSPRRKPGDSGFKHHPTCHAEPRTRIPCMPTRERPTTR